jgi:hypothetical protein
MSTTRVVLGVYPFFLLSLHVCGVVGGRFTDLTTSSMEDGVAIIINIDTHLACFVSFIWRFRLSLRSQALEMGRGGIESTVYHCLVGQHEPHLLDTCGEDTAYTKCPPEDGGGTLKINELFVHTTIALLPSLL